MILRFFRADGRKLTAHTVNTLAKLLNIIVGFQVFGNLGIAGEMSVADVIGSDNTRQLARCFEHQAVVEHLYLYLSTLDTIIAVANRVHRHLLYHELGIFPVRLEESIFAQIGMFLTATKGEMTIKQEYAVPDREIHPGNLHHDMVYVILQLYFKIA